MPLTLEPGCICRRKASTGTGGLGRHIVIAKVYPAMGFAQGLYVRHGKTFGYRFRRFRITDLDVILNSPARIRAEALAASQPDPYAGHFRGQSGAGVGTITNP